MESNTPGIVGGFKSNFFVCLLVIEFVVALFEAEEEEEEEELAFVVVPTTAPVFSVFFFLATTEDASAAAAKLLPKPNKGIWWSRKSPLFLTSLHILSSTHDKAYAVVLLLGAKEDEEDELNTALVFLLLSNRSSAILETAPLKCLPDKDILFHVIVFYIYLLFCVENSPFSRINFFLEEIQHKKERAAACWTRDRN